MNKSPMNRATIAHVCICRGTKTGNRTDEGDDHDWDQTPIHKVICQKNSWLMTKNHESKQNAQMNLWNSPSEDPPELATSIALVPTTARFHALEILYGTTCDQTPTCASALLRDERPLSLTNMSPLKITVQTRCTRCYCPRH